MPLDPPLHAARHSRWWQFVYLRSRPRWTGSAAVFFIAFVCLKLIGLRWAHALVLAFDCGALLFLGMAGVLFTRAQPRDLRQMAESEDAGRWGVLWGSTGACLMVIVALGAELHSGRGVTNMIFLVVFVVSIICAWLFMNAMFAMHYAHGYYGDYGRHGIGAGLIFPGTQDPDYWDFMYMAVMVGVSFSCSDIQITGRIIRRTAMVHAMVAFFFNAFVIALGINIVASLI